MLYKYPRTYHLPWSPGRSSDDKILKNVDHFKGKSVVVSLKLDGECFSASTSILMSDFSKLKIEDIVNGNMIGRFVKGKNVSGEIIDTPILDVFENGITEEWLKLYVRTPNGGPARVTYVTPNHIYFKYNTKEEIRADDLTPGTMIIFAKPQIGLTEIQKQVILGKLFGDGSLHVYYDNSAQLQFSHKYEHAAYVEYSNDMLGEVSAKKYATYISGFGTKMYKSWTRVTHSIFKEFNEMVGSEDKQISKRFVENMSPITLAFWYMDDGSLVHNKKQRDRLQFSTCGFNKESCNNLSTGLYKLGIASTITTHNEYNYINISADTTPILSKLIAPYVIPIMQYKLPLEFRTGNTPVFIEEKAVKVIHELPVEVTRVEHKAHKYKVERIKYNIETGTHNYFANNILVHNCTTLYKDHLHARSLDSKDHPSRHWLKAFHAKIKHHIPEGWRVCGEDLFAKHDIAYIDLPSYFMVFSVWNDKNQCLSWSSTKKFCEDIFALVPVFHQGEWFPGIEKVLDFKFNKFNYEYSDSHEGYVIRIADSFDYKNFDKSVAKYVRAGRNLDEHWMFKSVIKNKLRI